MSNYGKFITFEGGEGTGKTTQVAIIKKYLESKNIKVVITREPGGTIIAEEIRNIVLGNTLSNDAIEYNKGDILSVDGTLANETRLDQLTEVLLLSAARRDHLNKIILPALEKGAWVLCDRFYDSTFAYQTIGEHSIEVEVLENLQKLTTNSMQPDLTLILDMPASEGLGRVVMLSGRNKFAMLGLEFHNRVRENFLKIAERYPERCHIIDASNTMEEVTEQIKVFIEALSGGGNGPYDRKNSA